MIQTKTSSSHVHKWEMMSTLLILLIFCFQLFLEPKMNYALGLGTPVAEQLYGICFFVFCFFWICSIILVVIQVVKLSWSLYKKRWALCVDRTMGLILFCLVLVIAGGFDHRCSESLLDGCAERLNQKADIQAIQNWANDFVSSAVMTNNPETIVELDITACEPSCIRELNPTYFRLFATSSGSYVLRLYFGGQLHPRWGVDIVDPHAPHCLFERFGLLSLRQYRYAWKPNLYLWHEIEE